MVNMREILLKVLKVKSNKHDKNKSKSFRKYKIKNQ